MKVNIVGAGISGLSVAQMLKDKYEVELFDARKKGGLIRCERKDGHLYHLVGGHVFNSKNQNVLDWFWSFFDKDSEFLKAKRNAKIWLGQQYVGYPIENHLHELLPTLTKTIISELLELYKQGRNFSSFDQLLSTYANFGDFLLNNFGKTLYDLYFEPYNRKIWQRSPFSISLGWLEGKLPMMNIEDVLVNNIVRKEEMDMVHASFFYPKYNGSQFIVDRFSEGLKVHEDKHIFSIKIIGGRLFINDLYDCDKLIFTGDIRTLPDLLQNEELQYAIEPWEAQLAELQSNGTTNLLCETDSTDISWLYLSEKYILPHRIIYTGNFSETNQPSTNERSCTVEFSGYLSQELAYRALKKLPGNLKPLSYHFRENSYVIQTNDTRQAVNGLKKALEPYGIYLLGRFAEWEYYNMDKCIESAMELTDSL